MIIIFLIFENGNYERDMIKFDFFKYVLFMF